MTKKHNSKTIKQSIPQCYEPLWNIWRTGRLLWQGDSCILYELLAEDEEAECLLLFPMHTSFLEQIKIFSCQQDLGFSPLKAYTIFEDCICLRLSSITPVSLATDRITTNGLQFFCFVKNTLCLLFKLAGQGIWLSGFIMEDAAFLPEGMPILFRFHKIMLSQSQSHPLQDICKFLIRFCKKYYPSCLVYLEQLFNQCAVSDIYRDTDAKLPPNALLEFYTILIKGTEKLCKDLESELAAIPGTIKTPSVSSQKIYGFSCPATEFNEYEGYAKRRRICALGSLLLLMACLCIVIFYSLNKRTSSPGEAQTTFHTTLSSKITASPGSESNAFDAVPNVSKSASTDSPVLSSVPPHTVSSAAPVDPPTDSSDSGFGETTAPISTTKPISTPEPIQYLDLHGKMLHTLPPSDTPLAVWTMDCSSNALTTLSGLSEYTGICELYANNNQLTELDAICTQKSIQVLLLQNNRLTDILPVQDLPSLKHLDVSGNQYLQDITVLFHMPSLQFINLMDTKVSEKDIKKLRRALPDCQILPETY